jgi:outer membrane receptor protein involved in Fe transport
MPTRAVLLTLASDLVLALFVAAAPARAQEQPVLPRGTAVILATVVAGDTGDPVANATAELWSAADSTRLSETLTNAQGVFRFAQLREGVYYVRFVSVGYGEVFTEQFELADDETRNLGTLRLPVDALALDPIEVSAERTAVTFEADRTSYNLGVMGAEGRSVTETFQSIPELEVDIDGRLTLRGNAPAIYINGRPAPMSGEALTMFLEQFPADYLQKIEVLDNPSARYGAEGSGGIVNLVMREGVELGLSGSAFANAGTRGQYGVGTRGTLQRGDWTFNGGAFVRLSDNESTNFDLRQNLIADPAFLRQDSRSDRSGLAGNIDFETRYQASERMRVHAEAGLRRSGNESDRFNTTTHLDEAESPILIYDRTSTSDSRSLSADISTGFDYEWERREHELQFEVQLQTGRQRGDSREEITADGEFDGDELLPAELTLEDEEELERELSIEIDYTRPLGEDMSLEVGYDVGFENSDRDRLIRFIDDPDNAPDGLLTDRGFDQRQTTNSVYTTLRRQFGDFGVQLGLRAEHLDMSFEVPTGDEFRRDYFDMFPSANLSYRFDQSKQVRVSYSRRIGRPGASVLNPVDLSTDPLNRRIGNPDIEPQYTHSVSLNASWSGSAGNLRLSPYYQRTTNDWAAITTVDDQGISTRTYQNLASQESYGASLTYSMRQRDGWGGHVSISGRKLNRDASNLGQRYSGSSFRWSSRANVSARVTDALSAQGNFSYSPPEDLPQGRSDARYTGDLGLRYQFLDNRASVRLSLRDPFGLRETSSRMADISYIQIGRSRESTRSAQINVSYSLGGGGRMRGGPRR